MPIAALFRPFYQAGASVAFYAVLFIVVDMQLYPSLRQQLEDESKSSTRKRKKHSSQDGKSLVENNIKMGQSGPLKRLAIVQSATNFIYKLQLSAFIFFIVHRALIYLISSDFLSNFHYIDCFILGRFRYAGHSNEIGSEILICLFSNATLIRYVHRNMLLPMNFHAIDFLLYDYEEVLAREIQYNTSLDCQDFDQNAYHGECYQHQTTNLPPNLNWRSSASPMGPITPDLDHSAQHANKHRPKSTFCFKNPFFLDKPIGADGIRYDKWISRLNRTSKSWMTLSWSALLAFSILPFIIYFSYQLVSSLIAGLIWSNLGYELSYPTCVAWIQKSQQQYFNDTGTALLVKTDQDIPYSSIYVAPKVIASQIPMDDIPTTIPMDTNDDVQLGWYSWVRITADMVVNIYWYLSYLLLYGSFQILTLLCSLDLLIEAREIRLRLEKLITAVRQAGHEIGYSKLELGFVSQEHPTKLREQLADLRQIALAVPAYEPNAPIWCSKNQFHGTQSGLRTEITNIQALLVDHFAMVKNYNALEGFSSLLYFAFFAMYSLVLGVWIGKVHSQAAEREFMITESVLVIFAIVNFSTASIVRTVNYRLYEPISSAMALDQNVDSKLRWLGIINHYTPRSMYCFTLFGSSEISWLFSLKFVAWYYSALMVVASFYYMSRR